MDTRLQFAVVGFFLLLGSSGCTPNSPPQIVQLPPQIVQLPQAKAGDAADQAREKPGPVADLPSVLGPSAGGHGPEIKIWVNGDLYVEMTLRDNEVVSAEQLGNYLARIRFKSTNKVTIRPDEADGQKARLKAKFELALAVNRRDSGRSSEPVMRMTFDEMRFARSVSNPEAWVLSADGIELIERARPQK